MSNTSSERSLATSLRKGFMRRCPDCGKGRIFKGYIKVNHTCDHCGLELFHQRADDAPPYFTMMIVLHFIVSGLLFVEKTYSPETWVHMVIWFPVAILSSLVLLPHIKGALIGLQWARKMHGFDEEATGYSAQQID
ncbi:DUF983 domain-containing protein [Sneathiella aquimaris]|uniref:DUF983 domain-containing protein n=1 Tax=Sneathiella aquimaris TaxID=2599305 RepID=UPI00146B4801|nr:DUF983 domain-containing protein [Sneathiella aquimaris]